MAAAQQASYFDTYELAVHGGQVVQRERRGDDGGPAITPPTSARARDHTRATAEVRDALVRLEEAIACLQQQGDSMTTAHGRGVSLLRGLSSQGPEEGNVRALAAYFLGMCHWEGRGVPKR